MPGKLNTGKMKHVLRFAPPLIVTAREIDRLLDVLSGVLTKRLAAQSEALTRNYGDQR